MDEYKPKSIETQNEFNDFKSKYSQFLHLKQNARKEVIKSKPIIQNNMKLTQESQSPG